MFGKTRSADQRLSRSPSTRTTSASRSSTRRPRSFRASRPRCRPIKGKLKDQRHRRPHRIHQESEVKDTAMAVTQHHRRRRRSPRQGAERQLPRPTTRASCRGCSRSITSASASCTCVSVLTAFVLGGALRAARPHRAAHARPAPSSTHDTYNQLFTLHGAVMVFLFIIPGIPAALGNFILPLSWAPRTSPSRG